MNRPIRRALTLMLLTSLALTTVSPINTHAAGQPAVKPLPLQPYVQNAKIGFSNGKTAVTGPLYDQFDKHKHLAIVTRGGKQGIVSLLTGNELIKPVWDQVIIPNDETIAILRQGRQYRYANLMTGAVSPHTFTQAQSFYLSDTYDSVVVFNGAESIALDTNGKVLVPLGKHDLWVVILRQNRYLTVTTDKLTLLHATTLKPVVSIPRATLADKEFRNEPNLHVRVSDRVGLVNTKGEFLIKPEFEQILAFDHGIFQVKSKTGIGLLKDGQYLVKPMYDDAYPFYDYDGALARKGEAYHFYHFGQKTSFTLGKGTRYLETGYVLGTDSKTGMYGIKRVDGTTVVPFVYPSYEVLNGVGIVLTRLDGKKGMVTRTKAGFETPTNWFDSLPKLRDAYEKSLPKQDTSSEAAVIQPLNDTLSISLSPDGKAMTLVEKVSGKPISKVYAWLEVNQESGMIVGYDTYYADLFSPTGKLLTEKVKVAYANIEAHAAPIVVFTVDDTYWTTGELPDEKREGDFKNLALVRFDKEKVETVSAYRYHYMFEIGKNDHEHGGHEADERMFALRRNDGMYDLATAEAGHLLPKIEQVQEYTTDPLGDYLLVKKQDAWDVYNAKLERVTTKRYKNILVVSDAELMEQKKRLLAYQDAKTGLYGLLRSNMTEVTPPKYTLVRSARMLFPSLHMDEKLVTDYVFTTTDRFGYLTEDGRELFSVPLYTTKPHVSYQPLQLETFQAFTNVMSQNPLALIDTSKPYRFQSGMANEFYYNVALYLGLAPESTPEQVVKHLIKQNVIRPQVQTAKLTIENFPYLIYYMVTGESNTRWEQREAFQWAKERGIQFEANGRDDQIGVETVFNTHFVRFLVASTESATYQPKVLQVDTLTDGQRDMLRSLIQVNGLGYLKLPLPLPVAEENEHLAKLVMAYNQAAASLFTAYKKLT